jgi:NitT/TauT family transport system substrate-binding protein
LASAYIRGLPIVLLAPGSLYSSTEPSTALLVAKTSPIRTAKDLAGKKIAVISLNSILHVATKNWIDKNGGDSTASQYIEMPISEMTGALQAGRVDAASESEPWVTRAKDQTRVLGYPFDSIASRFLITAWGANKNWVDHNPAAAREATAAVRQTAQWAHTHPRESAQILSKVLKIPLDVVTAVPRVQFGGSLDPALIQPVIDVAAKYKVLPHRFAVTDFIAKT